MHVLHPFFFQKTEWFQTAWVQLRIIALFHWIFLGSKRMETEQHLWLLIAQIIHALTNAHAKQLNAISVKSVYTVLL